MLFRIAFLLLLGHLIVTELVPSASALNSQINWWSYLIKRETGMDRVEQALRDIGRR